MSCEWSARWCSLDEIGGIQHLVVTDDGSAEGVARAHCLVEAADSRFAVSLQGAGGEQTGFWKCPTSECLVILFENSVVVVDLKNPAHHSVVDVHWVAGEPLVSSRYVVLWSFWAITLIASLSEITEERYDDADIEAVSLHAQPERLEMKMFVWGETVERTLLL
jgi:hypothetical protein